MYDATMPYDVVIAINRAVERYPADWWCFGDQQVFGMFKPLGGRGDKLRLFVLDYVIQKLGKRDDVCEAFNRYAVEGWLQLREKIENIDRKCMSWSGPSAVAWAHCLGAKDIDIYGLDMAGNCDFTGEVRPDKNPIRFKREQGVFENVFAAVRARGSTVTRYTMGNCR